MGKKILVLMLAVILMSALVGGAALAWFTDGAVSRENIFTAGTLQVELQGQLVDDIDLGQITVDDWEEEIAFQVVNTGSLPLKYIGSFVVACGEDPAGIALSEMIMVDDKGWDWEEPITLAALAGMSFEGELDPGDDDEWTLFLYVNNVNSDAQLGEVNISVNIDATQPNNPDWSESGA